MIIVSHFFSGGGRGPRVSNGPQRIRRDGHRKNRFENIKLYDETHNTLLGVNISTSRFVYGGDNRYRWRRAGRPTICLNEKISEIKKVLADLSTVFPAA